MNRLLKTVAVAGLMAVSSHVSAATTLDTLDDGNYFCTGGDFCAGLPTSGTAVYTDGAFARTTNWSAVYTDNADPNNDTYMAAVQFGGSNPGENYLDINNDGGVSSSLSIHYDISSLLGLAGSKAVNFTVIAAPAGGLNPTSITVKQGAAVLGSWVATVAIPGGVPGYTESRSFALDLLNGSNDLAFYIDGPDGYDLAVNQLSIGDIAPVPEAGEWAMLVAGLGVVGIAASRRRAMRA